ncbi:TIGR01777 family oxidoreductase [Pseudomonas sp. HR96]|uniref:TIGR01777 family oxidoreductase n=1 Tax=Pseudomonas sp. HR96 TaxID=1027966 RepID=UPI002A760EA9|nr:TIGR01777 family oxidoreductase [Pseudomonas sp. HR96]WPP00678.1 TIGR01777 family oxidoreductase [Pseudomonas sp. HR96]
MHILLTGGTGLIGRRLCQYWLAQGHRLTVLSRRPEEVPRLCGASVQGIADLSQLGNAPVDAVVNLAGQPIAARPWTGKRRASLWASRIGSTERLLAWLESRESRPAVLISGSAVGWYGDGGERELTEAAPPVREDFASQLCIAWEETALRAQALGIRVACIRTGLVLASEGGFLQPLKLPFKLGLGGPIGDGRQWMAWIHIDDQIALIDFILHRNDASGPYNACAPQPVRNREFARLFGRALHRPAFLPLPALLLRPLGEMSGLLLGGQHARPARLLEAGFVFRYTELSQALAELAPHL